MSFGASLELCEESLRRTFGGEHAVLVDPIVERGLPRGVDGRARGSFLHPRRASGLAMDSSQPPARVSDFYTDSVLPALAERLDQAFPEFGWRRDARGWVATNEEHTHARLGVRAERVVAHGPAPRGFLVHGGEPMLWTAYVSGGGVPRGQQFVHAVIELAQRAGIDPALINSAGPRDRRADLLEEFF